MSGGVVDGLRTSSRVSGGSGLERYWTTEEMADFFAVTPKTVRRWIEQGEIDAVKLHRQWRIPPREIARLFEESSHVR